MLAKGLRDSRLTFKHNYRKPPSKSKGVDNHRRLTLKSATLAPTMTAASRILIILFEVRVVVMLVASGEAMYEVKAKVKVP